MASLDFVTEESAKTQGMSAQSCQLLAEGLRTATQLVVRYKNLSLFNNVVNI